MVLITGGVVLAFVAIAFRSIILPFRSVLTIGMTILWVYGFADLGISFSLTQPHSSKSTNTGYSIGSIFEAYKDMVPFIGRLQSFLSQLSLVCSFFLNFRVDIGRYCIRL